MNRRTFLVRMAALVGVGIALKTGTHLPRPPEPLPAVVPDGPRTVVRIPTITTDAATMHIHTDAAGFIDTTTVDAFFPETWSRHLASKRDEALIHAKFRKRKTTRRLQHDQGESMNA